MRGLSRTRNLNDAEILAQAKRAYEVENPTDDQMLEKAKAAYEAEQNAQQLAQQADQQPEGMPTGMPGRPLVRGPRASAAVPVEQKHTIEEEINDLGRTSVRSVGQTAEFINDFAGHVTGPALYQRFKKAGQRAGEGVSLRGAAALGAHRIFDEPF